MLFVGDDWAEAHHDIEIQDEEGRRLAHRRFPEGLAGVGALHTLIADHPGESTPADVVVGIETDPGTWVQSLVAAGYQVYPINPLSVARYRERQSVMRWPGPKAILAMPVCWPRWCARIASTTAQRREIAIWPRRSRSWPEPIRT